MDKNILLNKLAQDKPQFHYLGEEGVRRLSLSGVSASVGDCSWAVGPSGLKWIADHLSSEMVTIETGAGYTTVLFAALAKHHYCCTPSQMEADKIRGYLELIGIPSDKLTFLFGSTDETLSQLDDEVLLDFAYIDGCHGYPFPALDWHYIDKHLKIGGIIGMDNVELRPVREHCEFLEENGTYLLKESITGQYFIRFYTKLANEPSEWISQRYSRAKKDPRDQRLLTRIRRIASKWLKPYLY